MSSVTRLEHLQDVWNNAAEVILDAEIGRPLSWMVPAEVAGESLSPPALLHQNHHFALTAFNPPGVSRTLEENTKANEQMWQVLRQLSPAPLAVHRAFGFNLHEDWREDGFCLTFPSSQVPQARQAILAIAAKFSQGAIFEYPPTGEDALEFTRLLVYVDAALPSTEARMKFIVPPAVRDAVIERPWAGPELS